MTCPECGSKRIHRSRRHGALEEVVLPALAILPFRCHDCKARFLRMHMPRRRAVLDVVRNPPTWARALIWTVVTTAAALGAIGLVLLINR